MARIKLDADFLLFTSDEQLVLIRLLLNADENGNALFSDRKVSRETGVPYQKVRSIHSRLMKNGIIENADKSLPINAVSSHISFRNPKYYGLVARKSTPTERAGIPEEATEKYKNFIRWIEANAPYCYSHLQLPDEVKFYRLKEKYSTEQIINVILQIENRLDLRKRYKDLYLTALNWLKRDGTIQ